MSGSQPAIEEKLRQAAKLLKAGQKNNARQLLREVLAVDADNLNAWELLSYATYNAEEQIFCLKRILALKPSHPWARQRLGELTQAQTGDSPTPGAAAPAGLHPAAAAKSPQLRKQRWTSWLPLALAGIAVLCAGAFLVGGWALLRKSTSSSNQQAECQDIIQKAIQASGTYCNQVGADQVCYGNTTLQASLLPNAPQRFSQRGDILDVGYLQRLSASPLDPTNDQWGIAVFKVLANLPHSLPGQVVTLLVFGNTSLSKDTPGLESFYFSSEFGQMVCEKAPYDGILINVPDGSGVHFIVNGADLTLTGDASLKAAKNGNMQVSLYSGSGRIISAGRAQYFGAGQEVSVQLGGPDGMQAVSPPSPPTPLSGDDLNTACAMTGRHCTTDDIQPVGADTAEAFIKTEIGTPTLATSPTQVPTRSFTPTRSLSPTPSVPPTRTTSATTTPTPSRTSTQTTTRTRSATPTRSRTPTTSFTPTRSRTPTATLLMSYTPTRTATSTRSRTPTNTPTITRTPSPTPSPTATSTASNTPTPSDTPTDTQTPTQTLSPTVTPTASDTPTDTETPTATNTEPTPTSSPTTVTILVGDDTEYSKQGSNTAGLAEAFQYTAGYSGTATTLSAYTHANNAATKVVIGIYSDSSGSPGSLQAHGTYNGSAVKKGWITASLSCDVSCSISAGTKYWIAILEPYGGSGGLAFVEQQGGTASQISPTGSTDTTLPSTWPSGATVGTDGSASLYASP